MKPNISKSAISALNAKIFRMSPLTPSCVLCPPMRKKTPRWLSLGQWPNNLPKHVLKLWIVYDINEDVCSLGSLGIVVDGNNLERVKNDLTRSAGVQDLPVAVCVCVRRLIPRGAAKQLDGVTPSQFIVKLCVILQHLLWCYTKC